MSIVRVLLVDDHLVVREGLRAMLGTEPGVEIVGECDRGEEAVRLAAELRPDVVLMDLRMPGSGGTVATEQITAAGTARVLALTTYDTDGDVLRAVEAGAVGYLLKSTPKAELVAALRATARGEAVLAPSVATKLVRRLRGTGALALTAREVEVLACAARGASNAEIGRRLFITEATVKTHLLRAFAKLGVNDRTAAVATAIGHGIIEATSHQP